jgi:PleD family two-component response regulator
VVTTLLMAAGFCASALYNNLGPELLVPNLVVLALAVLVCTIAMRDVEKPYRSAFLEFALIGELVARDGLTGLMNRRAFDQHLLAARFGGEEFAVVFYDLPTAHLHEAAEHLRQRVQALHIRRPLSSGTDSTVTVSIGGALVTPTVGRTPQGAIQLADEALYEAKRDGRNRIVVKGLEDYRLLATGAFKRSQLGRLQS